MAKKIGAGRFDSPGNLWGKPLGRPTDKTVEEKVTGMRSDDSDSMEEEELDVDAELADADEQEDDIDEEEENVNEDSDAVAEDDVEDDEVDDDGLTYAPEAGDEPAEEENVVSAVDTDTVDEEETADDEEISAAPTESRIRMADKKKVSLSDHVRAEIDKRKAAGSSLRGVDIVAALEKRGINVSAAQVSQLLKKAGLGGKPRKRKEAAAETGSEKIRAAEKAKKRETTATPKASTGRAVTTPEPRAATKLPAKTNGFKVPMAQLQAAEAFVDACGGSFKDAERILLAASQLSQTFGG